MATLKRGGVAVTNQDKIDIRTDLGLGALATVTPGTGVATFLGTPSSANLLAAVTDETGTGALVFATSPTLVTPALGTPSSATLTNATGLPVAGGISGLGTGIATALAVNVGSAGAPVLLGGAGGTPSSLMLTNATGLPNAAVIGLGTAATTAATAYATAAQGAKADAAAQVAGDLGGTPAAPTVPGLAGKQATLVSGTNIKTINGTSVLGSGDLTISGSGTTVENVLTSTSTTNALSAAQGKALKDTADTLATTVAGKADTSGLGTAAFTAATAYATAAQGAKADTALQTVAATTISDGTAAGRALLTAANEAAQRTALSIGNVNNTADADKPISTATQTALNAKADLSGGKLAASQIPDLSVVTYLGSVANQSAMLALTGQRGDWCIRSDLSTTWIITGADPTLLAGWTQLSYPTAPVSSVAGRTGAVTLSTSDVSGLAALATVTPGTGIATALSVNVGSAGAPVLLDGSAGTPSSLTLTNATGLPAAGILDSTSAGRALLTAADAAAQRTALGLGTIATEASGSYQAPLVSATNIKTINGTSVLGAGNIAISGGVTNLAYTAGASSGVVTSDTGTDATIPLADGTNAGLQSPAQHAKVNALILPSGTPAIGQIPTATSTTAASWQYPAAPLTTADSFRNSGMRGQHADNFFVGNPVSAISGYMMVFERSRSNCSRRFTTLSATAMGGAYAIPAGLLTTIATDLTAFAAIGCQTIMQVSLTGGGIGIHEQSSEFWDLGNNGPAARAAHIAAVRSLALQYAGDERIAAISFMNEPWHPTLFTSGTFSAQMLAHQEDCIDAVREVDPNRVCMVTCAWYGAPGGYLQMRPVRQKNVVYEVHFYAPYVITHSNVAGQPAYTGEYPSQTQVSIDIGVGSGIVDGGAIANRSRMESIDLLPVIRFAQQYDVPIYVGEFTCTMMNRAGTATRWIEDAISVFEQYGFSWCQFGFWHSPNPWSCFEPGNSSALIDFNNGTTSGQAALSSFTSGSTEQRTPFAVVAHALRNNKLFRTSALLPSPGMTYSESFEGTLGPLASAGVAADAGMSGSNASTANPARGTKHAVFNHVSGAGPTRAMCLLADTGVGRTFDEYAFECLIRLGATITAGKNVCVVEANTNGGGSGAYWTIRNVAGTNTWQFEMWKGSGDYGARPFLNITGMTLPVGAYTKIRASVKQDPSRGRIRVWQDDKLLIDENNIATVTTNADCIWRCSYGLMFSDQIGQSLAFDDVVWQGGENLDWVPTSELPTAVETFLATPTSANLAAALTDETGTGAAVFANSPTLVTPNLGTPSALTLTNAGGLPASGVISGVPSAFTSRALANTDNGQTLICATSQTATVNTGLISGFGCAFKGTIAFTGSATVADVRTTGATNPWCALVQTGTNTYDAVGSKA
jgi:hypothetical protein